MNTQSRKPVALGSMMCIDDTSFRYFVGEFVGFMYPVDEFHKSLKFLLSMTPSQNAGKRIMIKVWDRVMSIYQPLLEILYKDVGEIWGHPSTHGRATNPQIVFIT